MYKVLIIPADTKIIVQEKAFSIGDKVRQFESSNAHPTKIDIGSVVAVDVEGQAILVKHSLTAQKWLPFNICRVVES